MCTNGAKPIQRLRGQLVKTRRRVSYCGKAWGTDMECKLCISLWVKIIFLGGAMFDVICIYFSLAGFCTLGEIPCSSPMNLLGSTLGEQYFNPLLRKPNLSVRYFVAKVILNVSLKNFYADGWICFDHCENRTSNNLRVQPFVILPH
ncbi:hypothetical protein PIB30_040087 [Stylosanthes scabra]|uniref:Uncharacterized protein n=1 Tax=Stylosanthes scabra TaxID=79078 RepID=A0ABU6YBW9_9FABA|nr:hypothetical protein [Stylosanthes scabra]